MGFLLFITALVLFFFLTIVNYFYVENKDGYFRSTAKNIDVFANREFRAFWNKTLRTEKGYPFGSTGETISSALGKNQIKGTLTKKGHFLVSVLDFFETNHCILAITNENQYYMNKLTEPTPKNNVLLWQLGTFIYALIVFINENTAAIAEIGLSDKVERFIKVFGLLGYFLFTFFNFNKSTLKT